eukprot:6197521-Pleurochrysis_carterae.AAC.3
MECLFAASFTGDDWWHATAAARAFNCGGDFLKAPQYADTDVCGQSRMKSRTKPNQVVAWDKV